RRKQIVHNLHVVRALEGKGAVFVESEDDVPEGAVCVLSAHGVSPAVHEHAARRSLSVVDATCPLVAKVHVEARRFAAGGKTIFLIGHANHEEIEGTYGEAPDQTIVIERPEDIDAAGAVDPAAVAYLTQTTLAVDDTAGVVEALRKRFPGLAGPRLDDICYASQNRQLAVKALAARSDLVLIVGSGNSSNANRLVQVARAAGAPAWLGGYVRRIDAEIAFVLEAEVEDPWLRGAISYHFGWAGADFVPLPAAQRVAGGKRLRPALSLLCYQGARRRQGWAADESDDAIPFATALELVHNYSLIHDDIQDRDLLRRG